MEAMRVRLGRLWSYAALLAGLLAIGAVIRWHNIGDFSLWLDELSQVTVARADGIAFLEGVRSHTAAAPLDYVGTKLVMSVLGFSTIWPRIWPFAMSVLTILLVERLTLELSGRRSAAISAAILTVPAAFLVFYAQEARFYTFTAATAIAGVWAFARADRLGRTRDWAILAAAAVVALYTHYFFGLLFLALGAWFVAGELAAGLRERPCADRWRPHLRRLASFMAASVIVGLAFLPWYLYAARDQLAIVYDYPPIPALDLGNLWRTLLVLISAVPRVPSPTGDAVTDAPFTFSILALAIVGARSVVRRRPVIGGALVSFVILLIPIIWAADQRSHYFVSERQFIVLVPLLLAFAGCGASVVINWAGTGAAERRATMTRIGVAAILATWLVAASVWPLHRVYAGQFRPHEDWRAASAFVAETACPGGTIYSNINAGYGFGVGVYAPKLLDRLVYLQERGQNEWLLDVIDRYPITTQDTIVVFRDRPGVYVAGRGTLDTITDFLEGRGFGYRNFTPRIRIFVPRNGCADEP
jgi:uncharacterized membrane protein